ncbi:hypothetical protein ACLB2K_049926 [Fragaria x ananassa]
MHKGISPNSNPKAQIQAHSLAAPIPSLLKANNTALASHHLRTSDDHDFQSSTSPNRTNRPDGSPKSAVLQPFCPSVSGEISSGPPARFPADLRRSFRPTSDDDKNYYYQLKKLLPPAIKATTTAYKSYYKSFRPTSGEISDRPPARFLADLRR